MKHEIILKYSILCQLPILTLKIRLDTILLSIHTVDIIVVIMYVSLFKDFLYNMVSIYMERVDTIFMI